MTAKEPRLTRKQELFVQHYLTTNNLTESAKLAGYSEKYANREGWRQFKNPTVAAMIHAGHEKVRAANEVTAQRVMDELANIAFDTKGRPSDRVKALELLGRRFALFVDRQEITGKDGAPLTISADATPEQAIEAYSKLLQ